MSKGPGKTQLAILAHLEARGGGDLVEVDYEPQVRLAPGIHDMRAVAKEMNRCLRGFSDSRRQAAFSRAVWGLIERRMVEPLSLAPLELHWPGTRWSRMVHELADGLYLAVPRGAQWKRRFVRFSSSP